MYVVEDERLHKNTKDYPDCRYMPLRSLLLKVHQQKGENINKIEGLSAGELK